MFSKLTSSAQWWVWCVVFVYVVILSLIFIGAPVYHGEVVLSEFKSNYLYQFLLEWQTAIGALLGFLGLMIIEALRRGAEFRYSQENDKREKDALVTFLIQESSDRIEKVEKVARNLISLRTEMNSGSSLKLEPSQVSNIEISEFRKEEYVLSNLYLMDIEFYDAVLRFLKDYSTAFTYQKRECPAGLTHIDNIALDKLIASATKAELSGRKMLSMFKNGKKSWLPLEFE